jgi:hypothetical protein
MITNAVKQKNTNPRGNQRSGKNHSRATESAEAENPKTSDENVEKKIEYYLCEISRFCEQVHGFSISSRRIFNLLNSQGSSYS